MKHTMRFLVRLYPSSWRKRYGVEFNALLEDATLSKHDAFDIFLGALKMQMTTWGFARITLACSMAGILVAALVSFAVPVHYVSQTVLTVTHADKSAVVDESARGVMNDMKQYVFSREYLMSAILEHNLYPRERARMPLDDLLDKMKKNTRLDPVPPASPGALSFAIQFDYPDRHVAQQVDTELVSRFIEAGALYSQPNSGWTFRVLDSPTLPLWPTEPNRTRFGAAGLLGGLLVGLSLAVVVRSRRNATLQND
jgi:hypothetical protein